MGGHRGRDLLWVESQGAQGTSVECWGSVVVDRSESWNDRELNKEDRGWGTLGACMSLEPLALQLGATSPLGFRSSHRLSYFGTKRVSGWSSRESRGPKDQR